MKIHNVAQGSAEWLALRAKFRTASEAPAMMGASKYQSRTDLLMAKKTGITPDVTPSQQFIFDKGHATEAMARPLAEALIGEELYPIVATEGNLLASMDGATTDSFHSLCSNKVSPSIVAPSMDASRLPSVATIG